MSSMDDIRNQLAKLTAMQGQGKRTDEQIREAAHDRLNAVNAELDKLRSRVHLDPQAARDYENLVVERGHLNRTIEQ